MANWGRYRRLRTNSEHRQRLTPCDCRIEQGVKNSALRGSTGAPAACRSRRRCPCQEAVRSRAVEVCQESVLREVQLVYVEGTEQPYSVIPHIPDAKRGVP